MNNQLLVHLRLLLYLALRKLVSVLMFEVSFNLQVPRLECRALCCSSTADTITHPRDLLGMQGMQPSAVIQAQDYHEP